tara:strand:- start:817 stop:1212 length:396 start_codon:yes stop_codon:yes gene_type:complete
MMGEEFYCSLKLVSGEEIFSLIMVDENDGDPIIILQNPVIMKMQQTTNGIILKIKPWMEVPNDDFYFIKFDKVITMTEVTDNIAIRYYEKYLNDEPLESDSNGKVNLTNKMGYISSVEDARNNLEKIFKGL